MKQIFLPKEEELYQMQEKVNLYPYLYAKAIESLCADYGNYVQSNNGEYKYLTKDIVLNGEYKDFTDNEIISRGVCIVYPNELENYELAKYDPKLALRLLDNNSTNIERIDIINRFSNSIANNILVKRKIISILAEELNKNPRYRFSYKDNEFLNDIFMGRVDLRSVSNINDSDSVLFNLSMIEPYYALKSNNDAILENAMIHYSNRYGIPYDVKKEDILTNKSTNVKKLIRCINKK